MDFIKTKNSLVPLKVRLLGVGGKRKIRAHDTRSEWFTDSQYKVNYQFIVITIVITIGYSTN
jgi:hypothetical protein